MIKTLNLGRERESRQECCDCSDEPKFIGCGSLPREPGTSSGPARYTYYYVYMRCFTNGGVTNVTSLRPVVTLYNGGLSIPELRAVSISAYYTRVYTIPSTSYA